MTIHIQLPRPIPREQFVPKINEPLVRATMAAIADDLRHWRQQFYAALDPECGTTFCFAGRAMVLQGYTVEASKNSQRLVFRDSDGALIHNLMEEAAAELGFTGKQAVKIFMWFPEEDAEFGTKFSQEENYQEFAKHVLALTGIDCR